MLCGEREKKHTDYRKYIIVSLDVAYWIKQLLKGKKKKKNEDMWKNEDN